MKISLKNLLLLLLLVFSSCKSEFKKEILVDKLSSIENGLPSPHFNYRLYLAIDNNKILETNIDLLFELYKDEYSNKYSSLKDFLKALFLHNEIIKVNDLTKYKGADYLINFSEIDNNINLKNIEDIQKEYLKAKNGHFLLFLTNLNSSERYTILYRMFENEYLITLNDYVGYYNLRKYD